MPRATLRASKKLILYWLANELENEIPDVDIYGSERKLLDFAYQDLETCLTENAENKNFDLKAVLKDKTGHDEIKAFLKIWTKQWLGKWRERVTFCQKMPKFSLEHVKAKQKATKRFKRMENGQELKKLIVQKLINNGEVCMAELIAENLIIEEMAARMRMNKTKAPDDQITLDPWDLFQNVSPQVKRLIDRKTPLIHLKLMTDA